MTREEELIFTALCDRFRSPTQVWQSMSLGELEEATGLAKESLEEALRALRAKGGTARPGRPGHARRSIPVRWRPDLPEHPDPRPSRVPGPCPARHVLL